MAAEDIGRNEQRQTVCAAPFDHPSDKKRRTGKQRKQKFAVAAKPSAAFIAAGVRAVRMAVIELARRLEPSSAGDAAQAPAEAAI